MAITPVQQGLIVEHEFAKLLMMGSGGKVELARPLSDDERRDYEVHVQGQYGFGLAIQVKSNTRLRLKDTMRHLHIYFATRASRVVSSPYYWYFFAYLDPKGMGFGEPTFLIPSKEFHDHGDQGRRGDLRWFTFGASMEERSRDHWQPYRVGTLELGARVLEIMHDLNKQHAVA